MSHDHHHASQNLKTAFWLNFLFSIAEAVVGILTNSNAVLSDALHDFGDSLSIAFAWFMQKLSGKTRSDHFSYGYRRFSLLAAFFNTAILSAGMVYVFFRAIPRLANPEPVHVEGMAILGVITILINYIAYRRVHKGKSYNEKSISWHLLEDILGGVLLLVVSLVMMFYPLYILDSLLSIVFATFILYNVLNLLIRISKIFLQSIPENVKLEDLEKEMISTSYVKSVHDMHVWSLDGEYHILTAHVVIDPNISLQNALETKCSIKQKIHEAGIDHATIEIEREGEDCDFIHC
ncbi:MAG: cation transporter [Candidatus Hydrogenedentota bacterium]|nr:MAG: cation transporter [Candidatus Hydrogenedentota bacterium]